MHPVLFDIPIFGGVTVYTYGFLVATGFVLGIIWIIYETKRLKLDTAKSLDLVFYILVAAILGSRILYLIVNEPSRLYKEPWSIFMIWEGGLVFYGGLIASVIVGITYFRRKKMMIPVYLDVFTPAIALGHACGRIGCLMVGCCHGKVAENLWCAITFPNDPNTFAPANVPLYPTQIFESIGEFLIFIVLVVFRRHKSFDGQVFGFYLVCYSILRFVIEFFRGDSDRGYIIQDVMSTAQGVSIVLFILGIGILVFGRMRNKHQE